MLPSRNPIQHFYSSIWTSLNTQSSSLFHMDLPHHLSAPNVLHSLPRNSISVLKSKLHTTSFRKPSLIQLSHAQFSQAGFELNWPWTSDLPASSANWDHRCVPPSWQETKIFKASAHPSSASINNSCRPDECDSAALLEWISSIQTVLVLLHFPC